MLPLSSALVRMQLSCKTVTDGEAGDTAVSYAAGPYVYAAVYPVSLAEAQTQDGINRTDQSKLIFTVGASSALPGVGDRLVSDTATYEVLTADTSHRDHVSVTAQKLTLS